MKFTVVCYYTSGTPYQEEVKNLIQSLDRFGIKHDIRAISSLGGWQKNTLYKAQFIRGIIDEREKAGDEAIVWLDADSVVLRPPEIFSAIATDCAFYFKTVGPASDRRGGRELISASMYFAINSRAKQLLDMWIEENGKNGRGLEQWNLQTVLPAWRNSGGTYTVLPQSYCRIFDAPEDHRVIVQNQASRRFRKAVGE